jgi:hypothetical protein
VWAGQLRVYECGTTWSSSGSGGGDGFSLASGRQLSEAQPIRGGGGGGRGRRLGAVISWREQRRPSLNWMVAASSALSSQSEGAGAGAKTGGYHWPAGSAAAISYWPVDNSSALPSQSSAASSAVAGNQTQHGFRGCLGGEVCGRRRELNVGELRAL